MRCWTAATVRVWGHPSRRSFACSLRYAEQCFRVLLHCLCRCRSVLRHRMYETGNCGPACAVSIDRTSAAHTPSGLSTSSQRSANDTCVTGHRTSQPSGGDAWCQLPQVDDVSALSFAPRIAPTLRCCRRRQCTCVQTSAKDSAAALGCPACSLPPSPPSTTTICVPGCVRKRKPRSLNAKRIESLDKHGRFGARCSSTALHCSRECEIPGRAQVARRVGLCARGISSDLGSASASALASPRDAMQATPGKGRQSMTHCIAYRSASCG